MKDENENKKDATQILKEVGEMLVAYELAMRGWAVSKNLGPGYDLHIRKIDGRGESIERFIEVKTRDKIHSTGVHKNTTHFDISQKEAESCDFAICHLYGENAFFILSKEDVASLNKTGRGKRRFTVKKLKGGTFSPNSLEHYNRWDKIK